MASPQQLTPAAAVEAARARAASAKSREILAHMRASLIHQQAAELFARLGKVEQARREHLLAQKERHLIEVARAEAAGPAHVGNPQVGNVQKAKPLHDKRRPR